MLIYGKNVAREKLNSNDKINKIFLSDKFNDKELFNLIRNKKIKYTIVPNIVLDKKVDPEPRNVLDTDVYMYRCGFCNFFCKGFGFGFQKGF